MVRYSVIFILMFSANAFLSAQGHPEFLCHGPVPVKASADLPVQFQHRYFESGLTGSNGGVTLLNKTNTTIAYYVAIIAFADKDGNFLISSPVYNVTEKDQTIPLEIPIQGVASSQLARRIYGSYPR